MQPASTRSEKTVYGIMLTKPFKHKAATKFEQKTSTLATKSPLMFKILNALDLPDDLKANEEARFLWTRELLKPFITSSAEHAILIDAAKAGDLISKYNFTVEQVVKAIEFSDFEPNPFLVQMRAGILTRKNFDDWFKKIKVDPTKVQFELDANQEKQLHTKMSQISESLSPQKVIAELGYSPKDISELKTEQVDRLFDLRHLIKARKITTAEALTWPKDKLDSLSSFPIDLIDNLSITQWLEYKAEKRDRIRLLSTLISKNLLKIDEALQAAPIEAYALAGLVPESLKLKAEFLAKTKEAGVAPTTERCVM